MSASAAERQGPIVRRCPAPGSYREDTKKTHKHRPETPFADSQQQYQNEAAAPCMYVHTHTQSGETQHTHPFFAIL
jgi:hypothetical protein